MISFERRWNTLAAKGLVPEHRPADPAKALALLQKLEDQTARPAVEAAISALRELHPDIFIAKGARSEALPHAKDKDAPLDVRAARAELSAFLKLGDGGAAAIAKKGAELPAIAEKLALLEHAEVLGASPKEMRDRFGIAGGGIARHVAAHEKAKQILVELAQTIVGQVQGGAFGPGITTPSVADRLAAVAQHVGYAAGEVSRAYGLNTETVRLLLKAYFAKPAFDREHLADQLGKLATSSGRSDEVRAFVLDPKQDRYFDRQAALRPGAALPNLSSTFAGRATVEFAEYLTGLDSKKASALLRHVFETPTSDLQQMLKDPQGGIDGALLHFAALAHHLSWELSKLGGAYVGAKAGDAEGAVKAWNHPQIGPSSRVVPEDPEAAAKITDQIVSYMISQGLLRVPIGFDEPAGTRSPSRMLSEIYEHGAFRPGQRVLSNAAREISAHLKQTYADAVQLDELGIAHQIAIQEVANVSGTFAARALRSLPRTDQEARELKVDGKDDVHQYALKEQLTEFFAVALEQSAVELTALLGDGTTLRKDDAEYRALVQQKAGQFAFNALSTELGLGGIAQAKELARNARFGHLIPMAARSLSLPLDESWTAPRLAADLAALGSTLLKDDYFLHKGKDRGPGKTFIDGLADEAKLEPAKLDPIALEKAVRGPNATWMLHLLLRGKVEDRLDRLRGGQADLSTDRFPDSVQFNPPDVRDVEIFAWARHRLLTAHVIDGKGRVHSADDPNAPAGARPLDERTAQRMALAIVVFTLHKDLLQIRKAAGGGILDPRLAA